MRKCYYYAQTKDKELRIIELDRALFDPAWKPAQGKANPLIYQIFYLDLGPDNGFFNQYLGQDVDQSVSHFIYRICRLTTRIIACLPTAGRCLGENLAELEYQAEVDKVDKEDKAYK